MTHEAFARKNNEWGHGTMIERQGTRVLAVGNGRKQRPA
jgi:hypothetical protein